jgi:hypothetical protein
MLEVLSVITDTVDTVEIYVSVHCVIFVVCTVISTLYFHVSDWTESWCAAKRM